MAANSSSRSQQAPASNFDDVEMTDAPKEITINETLKIALPDKYQGSRQELDTFLLQLEIYFRFNQDKFTEKESKSIWAVSYLRGEAGKWIQPYLRDYFKHDDRERMQPTRTIFDSFEGFKTEIRRIFGNSNELEVAEDKIFNLKQTGSALKYATEFRRYAGTTKWDEVAIMSHYRKGLKPEVRLELDREGEDDDLNGLIKSSIDADDRLYRYKQTQRSYKPQTNHRQGRYRKNEGRPRYSTQSYGDPMELDATHHRNENDDPEKRRRRENNLCFECGKAGHRAADCRSKKTGGKKGNFKPKFGKGQLNATFVSQEHPAKTEETETFTSEEFRKLLDELPRNQEGMNAVDLWEQEYYRTPSPSVTEECIKEEIPADHAMMSWTACYDKFCGIHRSDKEATGWFPKKRKTRNQQSKETDKKQVTQQLNATGQAGQIYCKVKINGQIQQAMIDSGATGNFIAPEAAKYLGVPLQKKQKTLPIAETRPVQMNINQHSEVIQLDVVPLGQQQIILGMPWLKAHNPRIDWSQETVTFDQCKCGQGDTLEASARRNTRQGELNANNFGDVGHPVQGPPLRAKASTPPLQMQKPTTRQEIAIKAEELMIPEQYKKYEHVFKEPGIHEALPEHKPWDHEIILEEGKMPVHTPIYSMSADELKTLREYIDDNLAKGWIRESTSQVASPTIKLNTLTKKDRYPLPLATELRDRLGGATIFTKMDLRNGYHLIRMKEGEEWKTAFKTRYGLYEYQVMPFGLTNAPATFMRLMNNVLSPYLDTCCICYLDDILVYSSNEDQHIKDVSSILESLAKVDLLCKPSKCEFHVTETEFLGFTVSSQGLKMSKDKVKAVLEWKQPNTIKELQSFLGFVNFYRRFIRGYSGIATSLTNLTKKNQGSFEWTVEAQEAFDTLKQAVAKEPILLTFDPEKPIIVETDSSDFAIGAVLSQPGQNEKYTNQSHSTHGSYHQLNHKNLVYFTTTKQLNRRQVRWSETMANYNFKISYVKGSENARADALSRKPEYQENKSYESYAIFKKEGESLVYNAPQLAATHILEDNHLRIKIQSHYDKDATAIRIRKTIEPGFTIENETIYFHGKVYIPSQMTKEFVTEQHGLPAHGHQGIARTFARIREISYFPRMRTIVEEVVGNCDTCIRNKSSRHAPYGQLQTPDMPSQPWKSITWDFVVKLPLSKDPTTGIEYDAILNVVDRLTKFAYMIPFKETWDAEQLAYVFLRGIVSIHGVPDEIISDRDKLFTSKFWTTLLALMGIKRKLSTSFHPQTDGQTERTNQTMEAYLRCYVNYRQDNWVELLPMAQFAYNTSETETTKITPARANFGFNPQAYKIPIPQEVNAESAIVQVEQLKDLQEQLALDLRFISSRTAAYYNTKRSMEPTLKEGDKVYLLRRNIETKRPSNKLDHRKLGPFKIDKVIGTVNYRLKLPDTMNIHPVFHISLLEPAPPGAPNAPFTEIEPVNPNAIYDVETILDCKYIRNKVKYI
ncbi:hypothetical protein DID88_005198 [Monilinia fructigena]|uniref:Reverse transcriptase n=1 Tax=Monilinia fructigena TaxID=38457 RepID=A0A395IF04_9HELO|nr:hypothetical protein DID88_005198 [Monilinia fructigena]